MDSQEMNPIIPWKLRIIIPTIPREGKYDYLERTFVSVSKAMEALNVNYQVLAFSRFPQKPLINHSTFKFIQIEDIQLPEDKIPKIMPGYTRGPKVLRQNLDWVSMMNKWKDMCTDDEVYLYLEDDFTVCEHSEQHIMSMYLWALKHRSKWQSLRISYGFNGLFMQCRDTKEYLDYVWANALSPDKPLYPVDYTLGLIWTHVNKGDNERSHHTFRYNLLNHIGSVSSVGNENDTPFNPKCFESMNSNFNFAYEKFDSFDCKGYMVTPCKVSALQSDLVYQGSDSILSQSILGKADRNLLLTKMKGKIVQHTVRDGESCNDICQLHEMKCIPMLFPFANNCEEFRDRFKCRHNKCFGVLWNVWNHYVPFHTPDEGCMLQDAPQYKCDASYKVAKGSSKLCPCMH